MKNKFLLAAIVTAAAASGTLFAAQVGVSISIGEPGYYGRIDIGDYPPPQLIYREPLIIEPAYGRAPIYLNVPPGHAKNWRKHCAAYHACGEPVYFVQNNWYEHQYVPYYRSRHGDHHDDHHGSHGNDHHDGDHGHEHGNNH